LDLDSDTDMLYESTIHIHALRNIQDFCKQKLLLRPKTKFGKHPR